MELKNIIELAKNENGKIFVMDESGEIRLVIVGVEEYQKMRDGSDYSALSRRVEELAGQAEELNRKITEAQMEELAEETEPKARDNFYIEPIEEE